MENKITQFQGKYRWLSNFAPAHIVLDNLTYPSVEHAYQSAKSNNIGWKRQCADKNNTAGQIKRLSRKQTIRPDWEAVKVNVMSLCLKEKFKQEPYRSLLLETGDAHISEGNHWRDAFWGVDLQTGEGKNTLGKLIMGIRDEIKKQSNASLRPIQVWSEGYSATGESGVAILHGIYLAPDFDTAVAMMLDKHRGLDNYYSPPTPDFNWHTIWGCRLFDNEQDARKAFG